MKIMNAEERRSEKDGEDSLTEFKVQIHHTKTSTTAVLFSGKTLLAVMFSTTAITLWCLKCFYFICLAYIGRLHA